MSVTSRAWSREKWMRASAAISILATLLTMSAARGLAESGQKSTSDPSITESQILSRSLIREGDSSYLKYRYDQARRAYGDAAATLPGAYADIRYGDARWRELLQAQDAFRKRGEPCSLINADLVHFLTMELPQTYERGLTMAHGAPGEVFESTWLARAEESALCLRQLLDKYQGRPAADCADLTLFQGCLGKPLIGRW